MSLLGRLAGPCPCPAAASPAAVVDKIVGVDDIVVDDLAVVDDVFDDDDVLLVAGKGCSVLACSLVDERKEGEMEGLEVHLQWSGSLE